jgi:hypothetical protein
VFEVEYCVQKSGFMIPEFEVRIQSTIQRKCLTFAGLGYYMMDVFVG